MSGDEFMILGVSGSEVAMPPQTPVRLLGRHRRPDEVGEFWGLLMEHFGFDDDNPRPLGTRVDAIDAGSTAPPRYLTGLAKISWSFSRDQGL